jgi:hypothetical protein
MKALMTAAVATALLGSLIGGTPVRADEDCDNVVKALEDALSISTKSLEQTVEELIRPRPRSSTRSAAWAASCSGRRSPSAPWPSNAAANSAPRSPRSTSRSRRWRPRSRAPASDPQRSIGPHPHQLFASSARPLTISAPLTRRRKASSLSPVWMRLPMKMPVSIIGSAIATVMSTSRVYSPTAQ